MPIDSPQMFFVASFLPASSFLWNVSSLKMYCGIVFLEQDVYDLFSNDCPTVYIIRIQTILKTFIWLFVAHLF